MIPVSLRRALVTPQLQSLYTPAILLISLLHLPPGRHSLWGIASVLCVRALLVAHTCWFISLPEQTECDRTESAHCPASGYSRGDISRDILCLSISGRRSLMRERVGRREDPEPGEMAQPSKARQAPGSKLPGVNPALPLPSFLSFLCFAISTQRTRMNGDRG